MRLVLLAASAGACAAWFLSISARRTAGRISNGRELAEMLALAAAFFVLFVVF